MSRRLALVAMVVVAIASANATATYSAFSGTATNPANNVAAAPDFVAPTATPTVIAKEVGYLTGAVKPGGRYYVYANVTDTGNPASGVSSSASNVTALTATQSAASLAAGTYSVGGVSYNYRSALLTADAIAPAGTTAYAITSLDLAGNSRTESGLPVVVDSTAPSAAGVQSTNGGKTAGKLEKGDVLTLTYSEAIDPQSISSGWTGASMEVVVRVTQGGLLGFLNDTVTIYDSANTAQLPLGTVDLGRTDYVGSSMTFGASGTPSTVVLSPDGTFTIKLGRLIGGTPNTAAGTGTMTWTPSCAPYDAAGNSCSSAVATTESGSADKDF